MELEAETVSLRRERRLEQNYISNAATTKSIFDPLEPPRATNIPAGELKQYCTAIRKLKEQIDEEERRLPAESRKARAEIDELIKLQLKQDPRTP